MKRTILVLFALFIFSNLFSQSDPINPRIQRPYSFKIGTSINLYQGEPSINAVVGYFMNPKFEFSAKGGNQGIFTLGFNYHFNNKNTINKMTPFVGIHAGNYDRKPTIQLPIGINLILPKGFTASTAISAYYFTNKRSGPVV